MDNFVATVEEDENGDLIIPFPDKFMEQTGWLEGDDLEFTTEDNSIILINRSWLERQADLAVEK